MKMKSLLVLVTIVFFNKVCSENQEALSLAMISTEENESGATDVEAGLSSETLSEIHTLAKNISHSKWTNQESAKGEAHDKKEIRRSILRKKRISSELDAMKYILEIFDTDEDQLELLDHLEFLVHQYDVAVGFATMGGMKMITPLLFSLDDNVVSSVASVFGAAMQSNPTVQKIAVDLDLGGTLMNLLSHKSPIVISRIIFALSCLLRNSPEAQEAFLSKDGVSKFVAILKSNPISTSIKLKIIDLFSDLAVEHQETDRHDKKDRIAAFERSFANKIQKSDFCELIPFFLYLEDYDVHQRVVAAMLSLSDVCHKGFKSMHLKQRLGMLLNLYNPVPINEKSGLYPLNDIDKDLTESLFMDLNELMEKINEGSSDAVKYRRKLEL